MEAILKENNLRISNRTEKYIAKKLLENGCKILKRGWPDFLVISPSDKLFFLEVKSGRRQKLRKFQLEMSNALSKIGIKTLIVRRDRFPKELLLEFPSLNEKASECAEKKVE